jgi:hypothetical protein
MPDAAQRSMSSAAVATAGFWLTATSITPSPSHLAMRTPRRTAIDRVRNRNLDSSSIAACSPCVSQ